MKRFSPYTRYQINGETRCVSIGPDGEKKDSANWLKERIEEIRYIFLTKNSKDQYEFRKKQPEIIASILSGNDTFAVLPTGGGKTLCFQAPSIFFPGITLVITPLAALIRDQVDRFNKNAYPIYHPYAQNFYENIRFRAIYPGMNGMSTRAMFSEIQNPRDDRYNGREIQYKFLYVSPERLRNPKFLRSLADAERNGLQISHIVIDEVHCMSQWGFEFRESYLYIPGFIRQRPIRPIISAFTATATPKDISEIKHLLGFPADKNDYAKKKFHEVLHIEARKNLSLHIKKCSDFDPEKNADAKNTPDASLNSRINTLIDILEKDPEKVCIIYRTTTSGVDELYDMLSEHETLRDRIVKYHAQMTESHKERSKREFGSRNIMIATKAFGMGIDIKNISLIIHYDIPRSLEDYYQEVGRAGRDAESESTAECCLLYAAGPKSEKGTLQYTISWMISERESSGSGCMPVSSRFSDGLKEHIYFWSYYRLCYVMAYCNIVNRYPEAAHDFIISYLKNRFSAEHAARALDHFYDYIVRYYPVPPAEKERFISKCLFSGNSAAGFLPPCPKEPDTQSDTYRTGVRKPVTTPDAQSETYHTEIKKLIGEVNELHINNTHMANLLRHHPDSYRLNFPYILSEEAPGAGQEWKSRQNKTVKGSTSCALRGTDIHEDSAFIFVSDPASCEAYVNAAWDARQNRDRRASVIFTVNYHHIINGVFKMRDNRWTPLTGGEDLLPYERCIGCHVKGLFPRRQYSGWRGTKKSAKNPGTPETISETGADALFAYAAGIRAHELTFTLCGSEKLSYFDMCVLDAIYSIEVSQKETVYVQTIWEILTGYNPAHSTREKLAFRAAIQHSIDKMRAMTVSIEDNQCGLKIQNEVFLPLKDKPKGQKGYSCPAIPPLFLYAEEMNGQIIKVPISLFNMENVKKKKLWKSDFSAEFRRDETGRYLLCSDKDSAFENHIKSVPLNTDYESGIRKHIGSAQCSILDDLKNHTCSLRSSIDNALLCHYLIHRIAISKNRKRGNYILFSTIRSILHICEDTCLFHKKVIAVMNHYQRNGFFNKYYLYINEYNYKLTDGSILKDNAYFRAKDEAVIKYWLLHDTGHLLLSDFTLAWSSKYNEHLNNENSNFKIKTELTDALERDGRNLSASTRRELATVSAGRMDGIVLLH